MVDTSFNEVNTICVGKCKALNMSLLWHPYKPYSAAVNVAPRPSALIQFWIAWYYGKKRLNIPGLARAIGVTPAAVHNWISGERGTRRGISDQYWDALARFFDFETPEALLSAARSLYERERGPTTAAPGSAQVHPETPLAARAIAGSLGATKKPNPRRRPARRAREHTAPEIQPSA